MTRKMVLVHNMLADQGIKSYRLGMNYFADMSNQEYRETVFKGCLRSFNRTKKHSAATYHQPAGGAVQQDIVDWRKKGYVTEVKDQMQCGSCWAFSATGSLEGQPFRKTGKLISLSEQQLSDNGGWINKAFDYIISNNGIDTEESYPYEDIVSKIYKSAVEEIQRKMIWMENHKLVLKHNMQANQGIKSFRLGMTYFADMQGHRLAGPTFLRGGAVLPKTVDWIKEGYVTEVKDQQECGSSWAFSATGSLEGQTRKKTGKLVSLRKQQLVDCSWKYGNFGCMGGLMNTAFEYIKENNRIYTEESYPYEGKDDNCRFNSGTVGATCNGYVNINSGDEKALQEAVAFIGPISVAIDAAHISFQLYKSGIYDEPDCSSTELDHGVLAVGYGRKQKKDYWLVKNSWGLDWGDKGYIKMSRNKNNQCGIATNASYPLV
ncbi:hypothetical protein Q7C36_011912 [Tachysurus vachellii]|uniref:Cathepsin L n=1 Tax=Tachysurus vachellii TaxID=175792 RepID=A0AA88MWK7_TACVA|nr:hypothetical protein Q7C36_011912 [Tachysurus vachellii]